MVSDVLLLLSLALRLMTARRKRGIKAERQAHEQGRIRKAGIFMRRGGREGER